MKWLFPNKIVQNLANLFLHSSELAHFDFTGSKWFVLSSTETGAYFLLLDSFGGDLSTFAALLKAVIFTTNIDRHRVFN
jgi:hypothetical protein